MLKGRLSKKQGFTIIEGLLVAMILSVGGFYLSKSVVKNLAFSRFDKSKSKLDSHEARIRNLFANNQLCTSALMPLFNGATPVEDFDTSGVVSLTPTQKINEYTAALGEVNLLSLGVQPDIDAYGDQDIWQITNINFNFQKSAECVTPTGSQRIYFSTLSYSVSTNPDLAQRQGIQNKSFTKEVSFKTGVNVSDSGTPGEVENFVNCGMTNPGVCSEPPVANFIVNGNGTVASLPSSYFAANTGPGSKTRDISQADYAKANYGNINVLNLSVCTDTPTETVSFTDSSDGNPDHWEWFIRKVEKDEDIGTADIYAADLISDSACTASPADCADLDTIQYDSVDASVVKVSSLTQNISDGISLASGLYEVTLYVSNASGMDWVTRRIFIGAPPRAMYEVTGDFRNETYPVDHDWYRLASDKVLIENSATPMKKAIVLTKGGNLTFTDSSKCMDADFYRRTAPTDTTAWKWNLFNYNGSDNAIRNDTTETADETFDTDALTPGTYGLTLKVANQFGNDTVISQKFIVVGEAPKAFFTKTDPAASATGAAQYRYTIADDHDGTGTGAASGANYGSTYVTNHGPPTGYVEGAVADHDASADSKEGSLVYRKSSQELYDFDLNRHWSWEVKNGENTTVTPYTHGPATAEDTNVAGISGVTVQSTEADVKASPSVSLKLTVSDVFGTSTYEQTLGASSPCSAGFKQCEDTFICIPNSDTCPDSVEDLVGGCGSGEGRPGQVSNLNLSAIQAFNDSCKPRLLKNGGFYKKFAAASNGEDGDGVTDVNILDPHYFYVYNSHSPKNRKKNVAISETGTYRVHAIVQVGGDIPTGECQPNEQFELTFGTDGILSFADPTQNFSANTTGNAYHHCLDKNGDMSAGSLVKKCHDNHNCVAYTSYGYTGTAHTVNLTSKNFVLTMNPVNKLNTFVDGSVALCGLCFEKCPGGTCDPLPTDWTNVKVYEGSTRIK